MINNKNTNTNNKNLNICKCPFCESELENQGMPYCKTCNITIKFCTHCGKPLPIDSESTVCPECGQS